MPTARIFGAAFDDSARRIGRSERRPWWGKAEQGNAVDAFGPELVRISDASVGLGATDCCRSAGNTSSRIESRIERDCVLS